MALIQVSFTSRTLQRSVPLQVLLPVDKFSLMEGPPREEKPFKTLYLLHGLFGSCTDWVTGTRIKRWAQEKNLAVVMPSGDNAFYVDLPQANNLYGEFIGKELVDITRRMFPLSRSREDTFIAGLSMGGYGAIRNGLKYYETFGYIASFSGALHILEDIGSPQRVPLKNELYCFGDLQEAVKSDKNPRVLVRRLLQQIKENPDIRFPKILMTCGTQDQLIAVNRTYRDFLTENGFDLTWYEGPGGHDWDFWDLSIRKTLDWLPLDGQE
ncbi:MAG: esterase family protein [Provencibacterium sp.]|nr:esterase family protein [Provencibacterium sp.]